MNKTLATLGAGVLLCASPLVEAGLPGSISGPWYNPEQSGHGLSVDIVTPDRAVVIWHVFDLEGDPLTLYIEGDISGRRIDGEAYAPEGMRFGEFNRDDVELPHWGSVDIEFDNCRNATLTWTATDSAFGEGSMAIKRLGRLDGIGCNLPSRNELTTGLYRRVHHETGATTALVDKEGILWADGGGRIPGPLAGPVGNATVLIARPDSKDDAQLGMNAELYNVNWMFSTPYASYIWFSGGDWTQEQGGNWIGTINRQDSNNEAYQYIQGSTRSTLVKNLDYSKLAGSYEQQIAYQFEFGNTPPVDVTIDQSGKVCVKLPDAGICRYEGRLSLPDGDAGIIDFTLQPNQDIEYQQRSGISHREFRGRGWLEHVDSQTPAYHKLVLVGSDGARGFLVRAVRF